VRSTGIEVPIVAVALDELARAGVLIEHPAANAARGVGRPARFT
jgi:hypothetical protein